MGYVLVFWLDVAEGLPQELPSSTSGSSGSESIYTPSGVGIDSDRLVGALIANYNSAVPHHLLSPNASRTMGSTRRPIYRRTKSMPEVSSDVFLQF